MTELHKGIAVPEYRQFIPWLIKKSELYLIIPEKEFSISEAGWPELRFTILGRCSVFSFDFVTDDAERLTSLAVFNFDPISHRESFFEWTDTLLDHLGPPNSVDAIEYHQVRWDDGVIVVDNSIETGMLCGSREETIYHSMSIRLRAAVRH